jgi:hypothetical protein
MFVASCRMVRISRPPPAEQVQQALPATRLTRPCHCGRHGELPDETWIILGESVLHFGEQPLLIFGQTHLRSLRSRAPDHYGSRCP